MDIIKQDCVEDHFEARFYYMHDNHTFTRLYGTTVDEILKEADRVESSSSYGMLCPVILMRGNKEVRRVGTSVHSGSRNDTKIKWNEGKEIWKKEVLADNDIINSLKD